MASLLSLLTSLHQARSEIGLGHVGDAIGRLEACRREGDAVLEPVDRVHIRLQLFDAWLCARADDRAAEALAEARRLVDELEVAELVDEVRVREGRLEVARGVELNARARETEECKAGIRAFLARKKAPPE